MHDGFLHFIFSQESSAIFFYYTGTQKMEFDAAGSGVKYQRKQN